MDEESLADAVEQLEAIAGWEEHPVLPESIFEERDISERVGELRKIFGIVRDYFSSLQGLSMSGLAEIMATVGEAAHKLDAIQRQLYGPTFTSITTLPEYQELTRFYLEHLADRRLGLTDLESVKADNDYELFFLRHADGTPYVSPQLVDNLKVACDFGPLVEDLGEWVDRWHRGKAKQMLACNPEGDERALLALHLAASSGGRHFHDFLVYLRAHPSPSLAHALYTTPGPELPELFREDSIEEQYRVLQKHYVDGPLLKTLELLRESEALDYDPMLRGNVPSKLFELEEIPILRVPTPTHQATTEIAALIPEFLAFLESGDHLMINLQDRLSWKEQARVRALEGCEAMTVVTLAKDTPFYHQEGPYADLDEVHDFLDELRSQLFDEEGGYFFPDWLQEPVHQALDEIEVGERYQTRAQRRNFIERFQAELVQRLLIFARPDTASFCCKDGVDTSMAAAAVLYALNFEDPLPLREMLFLPALLIRERAMLPNRFHRAAHFLPD